MLEQLTGYLPITSPLSPKQAVKMLCCSVALNGSSGVISNGERTRVIDVKPSAPDAKMKIISSWALTYSLTPFEVERLKAVLVDYEEASQDEELAYELNCIMGDRKLTTMEPLTAETFDRAQRAFREGRTSFVFQNVD